MLKKLLDRIFLQFKELKKNLDAKELISNCELVIIDNNSADETSEMIFNLIAKRYTEDLELRYFLELEPGLNASRNRAIKESKAGLIAFLDDTLILDDSWLQEVYLLAREKPKRFAAGACIKPIWKNDSPDWLSLDPPYEIMQSCFAIHDYGENEKKYPFVLNPEDDLAFISDEDIFLDSNSQGKFSTALNNFLNSFKARVDLPLASCFLLSSDVFDSVGRFKNDYSLSSTKYKGFEELDFFLRLKAAGILIGYAPQVKLLKEVPGVSLTKKVIIDFYRNYGRNWQYVLSQFPGKAAGGYKAAGKFSLYLQLLGLSIMYLVSMILIDPVKIFWYQAQIAKLQGKLSV